MGRFLMPQLTKDPSSGKKDLLKLCDLFGKAATGTGGDGQSVLFWEDTWNNRLLKDFLPRLYSFARNRNISVAKFLQSNDIL